MHGVADPKACLQYRPYGECKHHFQVTASKTEIGSCTCESSSALGTKLNWHPRLESRILSAILFGERNGRVTFDCVRDVSKNSGTGLLCLVRAVSRRSLLRSVFQGPSPLCKQPKENAYGADFQRTSWQRWDLPNTHEVHGSRAARPDNTSGRDHTPDTFFHPNLKHSIYDLGARSCSQGYDGNSNHDQQASDARSSTYFPGSRA
jgi:hypothetical protein